MNIVYFISHPKALAYAIYEQIGRCLPSKLYLRYYYRMRFGKPINFDNPRTFNEKLNWLKVYDHNPLYTKLADKYLVKDYVCNVIGEKYVVPCYGCWNEDINFDELPNQFVLKATHDSSGVTVIKNKRNINLIKVKKHFNRVIKRNYYYALREWPYKNQQPKIIADQYLEDHTSQVLQDYKFWCFNGEPLYMYFTVKGIEVYENFYDMDFNAVDINHMFPRRHPEFEKPKEFELMKTLASKLSKDIPFVRVDFFDVDGRVYFGEFTFYDWAGMRPFDDPTWDDRLGALIKLPNKKS